MVGLLVFSGCSESASSTQSSVESSEKPIVQSGETTDISDPFDEYWENLTPRQQVASVFMFHYPGTDGDAIRGFLEEIQPAGVILMGDNIPDEEDIVATMVDSWQKTVDLPFLVGIDQEGGVVSRIDSDPAPGALELQDGPPELIEEAFRDRGRRLRQLGINLNFGIIADHTDDPHSFIYDRILGTTPALAARGVEAAIKGEHGLVYSTLKHFPDHGAAPGDSHTMLPSTDISLEQWLSSGALPFEAGIKAGVELIMTGHLRYQSIDEIPVSMSKKWNDILRDDLGFDGVIVTDSMLMLEGSDEYPDTVANDVAALESGASLVLDLSGLDGDDVNRHAHAVIDGVLDAIDTGLLDKDTVRDASKRVWKLRHKLLEK